MSAFDIDSIRWQTQEMDRWPSEWRQLAHEYGYAIVSELYHGDTPFDDAEFTCMSRRHNKQQETFATDHIPKKPRLDPGRPPTRGAGR